MLQILVAKERGEADKLMMIKWVAMVAVAMAMIRYEER
jgi:hypothetical protein